VILEGDFRVCQLHLNRGSKCKSKGNQLVLVGTPGLSNVEA
jgi:hypothetical protein